MEIIIKKNKIVKNIFLKQKKRGFVLLFAVVVSSVLLSVALGVSNIALKETFFSTSAKDANDAFYAADTAIECALFYDNSSVVTNAFIGSSPVSPTYCNDKEFTITKKQTADISFDQSFTFIVSQLGSFGKSCAVVTVNKMADQSKTQIISTGHSSGGEELGICNSTPNSVQRVIELNY